MVNVSKLCAAINYPQDNACAMNKIDTFAVLTGDVKVVKTNGRAAAKNIDDH